MLRYKCDFHKLKGTSKSVIGRLGAPIQAPVGCQCETRQSLESESRQVATQHMEQVGIAGKRLYGLDAARGVLIALGVLLHAANVYAPHADWIVVDGRTHPLFDFISNSIHVFRMPAFFWVSGLFTAMTFDKRGARALAESRFVRLFVPLLVSLLTLNVFQEFLVGAVQGKSFGDVIADGVKLYHLWFLVNLIVYTAVAALILPWLRTTRLLNGTFAPLPTVMIALVVLGTYSLEATARITGAAYVELMGVTLYGMARYAPYFAFGALMHFHPGLMKQFLSARFWLFFPALALAMFLDPLIAGPANWRSEVLHLAELTAVWVCVAALHGFFNRTFSRSSRFTELAATTSYSIYLLHHVITVAVALLLVEVALAPGIEFLILSATTMVLSLCIHFALINRFQALRFLFNGNVQPRVTHSAPLLQGPSGK
jgi:glucans biosynthesis protein C